MLCATIEAQLVISEYCHGLLAFGLLDLLFCGFSVNLYNTLMARGVCREQARGVLPQNLYTEYYGTCNLNNLIKFIELRTHEGAQWEIQKVAEACLQVAESLWPITIGHYREIRNL